MSVLSKEMLQTLQERTPFGLGARGIQGARLNDSLILSSLMGPGLAAASAWVSVLLYFPDFDLTTGLGLTLRQV